MGKTKWMIGGGLCAALALTGMQFADAYTLNGAGAEGTVFNDLDNDGVQDAGELGVPGVEVRYIAWADVNGDGVVDMTPVDEVARATTTTDSNGFFRFWDEIPYSTWAHIEISNLPDGWELGPSCPTVYNFDPTIYNWFIYANFCIREVPPEPFIACRFTGGGHDTDFNWDHTLEDGSIVRNGSNVPDGIDRYSFGGQAGASTALPPNPSGEWTHTNHDGPSGSFTFHGGTSSAPAGTRIVEIRCSDPGNCEPARPAPAKQLDFDGIGTFKNLGKGSKSPTWELANAIVTAEGKGNKGFDGTYHWFEVNVDDLGEPGRANADPLDTSICPPTGFGEKGAVALADCRCPDFYRITIYDGVDQATLDASGPNQTDVIYEAYGYIDGGNLQIHPPTGKDLKRAELGLSRVGPTPLPEGGRARTQRRSKVNFGRSRVTTVDGPEAGKTRTYRIKNRSRTERLVVTVGDTMAPFTGGGGVYVIPPRERLEIEFGFASEEPGLHRDTVVVQTSDPDRASITLRLKGRAK